MEKEGRKPTKRVLLWAVRWMGIALLLATCVPQGNRETQLRQKADSLNQLAYRLHYKDLAASSRMAGKALECAAGYPSGRAEALNNMGFCAFMRMDFEGASRLFKKAAQTGHDEVEALTADVGMMKICQRTSQNKAFYDYRNSALKRIKRIREEETKLQNDSMMRAKADYAVSEFHIVSGIYHYYLQQNEEALREIDAISEERIEKDTAQWLYYLYMRGSGGMYKAASADEVAKGEWEYLVRCLQASRKYGYIYFEANALQGMAELLVTPHNRTLLGKEYAGLANPEGLPVDSLPVAFAEQALTLFKRYGDWYQISGAYRTLATYYNAIGMPQKALPYLAEALSYVNRHHERYYHCEDTTDRLHTYIPGATESTELKWIKREGIQTVPEWITRLREQLSQTYSAMGKKAESDYNRNIYLDLLDYTRQDKEMESRYAALEVETRQLNAWILTAGISIAVLLGLFIFLNRRWRKRNRHYIGQLKKILELCREVMAAVPEQAHEAEEVAEAIQQRLEEQLPHVLPVTSLRIVLPGSEAGEAGTTKNRIEGESFDLIPPGKTQAVGKLHVTPAGPWRREERNMMNFLLPYIAWTLESGFTLLSLDEERRRLEKEQYIHARHLADNKRGNEVKRACFSIVTGILPYIDRVANEVHKLQSMPYARSESVKRGKFTYINELIDKINEYNDILALWIKMRQGALSLNIESFHLASLFATIAKGRRSFEARHQELSISNTTAVVKADKALTLFMINTLVENARKYVQEGGHIALTATETDDYVEVAVTDDGPGLPESDIRRILDEKVYDSGSIGMQTTTDTRALRKQKGHGFGLMNCKGIIEKYRKTNPLFAVCRFGIESRVGKGSRFFFRLPKGGQRTLFILLCLSLSWMTGGCRQKATQTEAKTTEATPPISSYDSLLAIADDFSNRVYRYNVEGLHNEAWRCADSVLHYLNLHYLRYSGRRTPLLQLYDGEHTAAELEWFARHFDTDYYILLDVRNEAAVASLARKDFRAYHYNNAAYTALYKQISEDTTLARYCARMQQSANNKQIALALCLLAVAGAMAGYYMLYMRHRLHYRYNMEQVFAVNRAIFAASASSNREEKLPERLVESMFDEMNELIPIEGMALAVNDEEAHRLQVVFQRSEADEEVREHIERCFTRHQSHWEAGKGCWSYLPLWVETHEGKQCTGLLALKSAGRSIREEDRLLVELVANYLAVILYNSIVRIRRKQNGIELAQDEARRVSFEENTLHVQNMVLDNCLSTIKHETLYYPNRIKQIVDRLDKDGEKLTEKEEKENLDAIAELVEYYKEVFTLLSSCAARQLEEVTFRRTTIPVRTLAEAAGKYLKRATSRLPFAVQWECTLREEEAVTGDEVLLRFLFENLIDEATRFPENGTLRLETRREENFIRFDFTDTRRSYPQAYLDALFYPDLSRMRNQTEGGKLTGTEYLVCKQVIRDHDEFAGRRGCRINASRAEGTQGFTVWFTLPRARQDSNQGAITRPEKPTTE